MTAPIVGEGICTACYPHPAHAGRCQEGCDCRARSGSGQGFKAPPAGTRMCAELVAWDVTGKRVVPPRPCKRAAREGSRFCGRHQRTAAKYAPIEVRDGGICVWCGEFGRSYVSDGVVIALCAAHGKALARAVKGAR